MNSQNGRGWWDQDSETLPCSAKMWSESSLVFSSLGKPVHVRSWVNLLLTIVSNQLKLKPDYCLQPALNWNWNLPIHIQSAWASATSGLRRRRHLRGTGALDWFCTNISTKVAILCTLVRKEDKNFNFFPMGTGIKKGNYCRLSYPKRRRRKSCRWPQGCCL